MNRTQGKASSFPNESFQEHIEWSTNRSQFFEKLMTVQEVAEAFGFAPQTIRNWVALRQIPFIRIGGKTRFQSRSIKAWIEQKEFKPCR
jgi:excisionase family DNA binding protein